MSGAEARARSNVNVALVKYWGKRDAALNLPATGSISLTLDGLWVDARVGFGADPGAAVIEIDGEPASPADHERLTRFFDLIRAETGVAGAVDVRTESHVPRGAGLASSAAA